MSREHEAKRNGLSGWNEIPYTSALWSEIVNIFVPVLISQSLIFESQEPDSKHHEISGKKAKALTLFSWEPFTSIPPRH